MEMNSAAWRARANWTRSPSATKVSSLRVMSTRYLPVFSILSRSSRENSSTMVFSISPLAALVPLSMPPRPGIAVDLGLGRRLRLAALGRTALERDRAHERLAVGRREVKHQASGLIIGGAEHEGHVDLRRARKIDDHARAALHHQAETERFNQAAARLPRPGRELERDLRHVQHHPVGISEREGADLDLLS